MALPNLVLLGFIGGCVAGCVSPPADPPPGAGAADTAFAAGGLDAAAGGRVPDTVDADARTEVRAASPDAVATEGIADDQGTAPADAPGDADDEAQDAPLDAALVPDAVAPDQVAADAPDGAPQSDTAVPTETAPTTDQQSGGELPPALDVPLAPDTQPGPDTPIPPDSQPQADVAGVPDAVATDTTKTDVPPAAVCGNGKCESQETCASCAKDCGCAAAMVCKNNACVSNWPPPPLPANCTFQAKVLTYNPKGWGYLGQALAADPAPCADYYIHLPALAGDKTQPRGEPALTDVHAYGGRFAALAEFHWGGWSDVAGMTWLQKGKEFRKRMVEKGYVVGRDYWAINELPSSVRTDKAVRQAVRDVVQGLYEGPTGAAPMGGAVYIIGMGQATQNFAVYKPNLKDWTLDAGFWQDMNAYVKWWGQEVYGDPATVCVGAATVAQRSEAVNMFAMHHARLAQVGPAGAAAAKAFFDESYTPLGSAFWRSDIYNTDKLTLDQMKHFASTAVYAARAWAANNPSPDARIALAWNNQLDGASEAEVKDLAARVASALRHAYDVAGPPAAKACSPSGAYTWCACGVAGAAFNNLWKTTFAAW